MTDRQNGLTYAQAGVDIDAGNAMVEKIKPLVRATRRPGADGEIGGFHREIMRRLLVVEREFAKQFLFQIQTEIVFLDGLFDRSSLLSGRFLRLRRGPCRLARVETHDTGQLRKGIVVRQVDMIGDF